MSGTDKTSLGDRMKGYEIASRTVLPLRLPVIIRVDGKAFHTFTRGMVKPFDDRFCTLMNSVALMLAREIQGAQIAYVQSDEISVLVHNYKRLNSQAWFDNQVQKMVSVAASIASSELSQSYNRAVHFDARVFVLPEAEVCNYFLWRQQDATRNSIQMLARSLYSHGECENKNGSELQEMCWLRGRNWNDLPVWQRRGRFVRHRIVGDEPYWLIDYEPILTEDRLYVEQYLAVEQE